MASVKSTKSRQRTKKKDSQKAKGEQFAAQLGGLRLLGEVITWKPGDEVKKHTDVIQALKDSGLDEKVAREFLPRHAFTRAAKKLAEEKVIDVLREDSVEVTFQITKRFLSGDEWVYDKETLLSLNKTTGKVQCPINSLEVFAQQELDRCMEARTTNDITKVVQTLFEHHADLMPFREQGGVYIVPIEHQGFVDKIDSFLKKLGGNVRRLPIPAGTNTGDQTVQECVTDYLEGLIGDHNIAVMGFGVDTRADTLQRAAEKIKATKVKIEAYAHYLSGKAEELKAQVEESNTKLIDRIQQLTQERAALPPEERNGYRGFIFEAPVTAVIRWMGKHSWPFEKTRRTLDKMGCAETADATIRAQLLAGRKGERGDPAKITAEQAVKLEEASKKEDK